uniref:Uncharacterized protein n=1 Tax=Zea mays TaxID=4577 RepID=A0A804QNK6_MAIZE
MVAACRCWDWEWEWGEASSARPAAASAHPAACTAGTRNSTSPSWASYLASPTRQSTPARCAARSCALTAATAASATAPTASPSLAADTDMDSAAARTRSSAANTYVPALMYSHRLAASAGPYSRASLAVASFTMAGRRTPDRSIARWAKALLFPFFLSLALRNRNEARKQFRDRCVSVLMRRGLELEGGGQVVQVLSRTWHRAVRSAP